MRTNEVAQPRTVDDETVRQLLVQADMNEPKRRAEPRARFIPPLRFHFLMPLYDMVVAATKRERRFKSLLLAQASIQRGERVLDVACGTGTVLLEIAMRNPSARTVGIDADATILGIARYKLESLGRPSRLVGGFAEQLPFRDAGFDCVISTLFFHRLDDAGKRQVAGELFRVLRPGGHLDVADWGRPAGALQRLAFYVVRALDGFANTAANVRGELPRFFDDVGFVDVTQTRSLRTALGTIRLLHGSKPSKHARSAPRLGDVGQRSRL